MQAGSRGAECNRFAGLCTASLPRLIAASLSLWLCCFFIRRHHGEVGALACGLEGVEVGLRGGGAFVVGGVEACGVEDVAARRSRVGAVDEAACAEGVGGDSGEEWAEICEGGGGLVVNARQRSMARKVMVEARSSWIWSWE
jgi:hypothetical protein